MKKTFSNIKETDIVDTSILYYEIPIELIPFEKLPIKIERKSFGYAKLISLEEFIPDDWEYDGENLLQVYNYFSNQSLKKIDIVKASDFLFGTIKFQDPPKRGKGRWKLINKESVSIARNKMPHLKNSPAFFVKSPDKYKWSYCKNGIYYFPVSYEASYEQVQHLESVKHDYDESVRLRIAFELIRIEAKKKNILISNEEWINIGVEIFKSSYMDISILFNSEKEIKDYIEEKFINNWLKQPIYSEIPEKIRDKAIGDHMGAQPRFIVK